jgi:MFS family permease
MVVVLTATFLGQFDFFVVNVAGPSIQAALGTGSASLELIVGGYAFAYAAGLVTAGRLGDVLGYRRMFVTGMTAFGLASLLCGISQSPTQLVLARLLQGAAASVMLPQVLAYITATIAPARRGAAIAWYGVAAGVGSICGQVLGGVLVEDTGRDGWRLIFLVNIPVALVAALVAALVLPRPARRKARFDPYGAVGVTATLATMLVPLTLGSGDGWPAWTWWCLGAAPVLAVLTAIGERRLAQRGGAPIIPIALLRVRTFAAGALATTAFMLFFPSFMFTLTLLLQDGLTLDPLGAGLVFVPAGVAYSVSALGARTLFGRFGIRAPLAGCALTGVALAALAVVTARDDTGAPVVVITLLAALMSLGNGVVMPTLTSVTLRDVPGGLAGTASGLLATVQQFASAAGVAAIGTVFFAVARHTGGAIGSVHGATASSLVDLGLVGVVAASLLVVRRAHTSG